MRDMICVVNSNVGCISVVKLLIYLFICRRYRTHCTIM